jgi:membrane-bound lytic murein transglycosylase A
VTGYYEPIVDGSRERDDTFAYPLYRKPASLTLGRARTVKVKGKRVRRGRASFLERAAIEKGALAGRNLEICYLKDPVDAFFVEIQGSARVRLNDGSLMRVNYRRRTATSTRPSANS